MPRSIPLPLLALTLTCLAGPASAQDAGACAKEVGRLSDAFGVDAGSGEAEVALAQEPGSRKGAAMSSEQRRQVGDLVQQARRAGEQGDSKGCLQGLAEARALLRQAGLGGGQPGTTGGTGLGSASDSGGGTVPGSSLPAPGMGSTGATTAPSTGGGGLTGGGSGGVGGSSGGSSGGGGGGGGG